MAMSSTSSRSFTSSVWSLLREIPRGRVTTYGDLARAVGEPRAARAVAQACARNPHPVTTPCHRVVRGDGSIGGYSGPGGVRRKASLLRSEGVAVRGGRTLHFVEIRYRPPPTRRSPGYAAHAP